MTEEDFGLGTYKYEVKVGQRRLLSLMRTLRIVLVALGTTLTTLILVSNRLDLPNRLILVSFFTLMTVIGILLTDQSKFYSLLGDTVIHYGDRMVVMRNGEESGSYSTAQSRQKRGMDVTLPGGKQTIYRGASGRYAIDFRFLKKEVPS